MKTMLSFVKGECHRILLRLAGRLKEHELENILYIYIDIYLYLYIYIHTHISTADCQ